MNVSLDDQIEWARTQVVRQKLWRKQLEEDEAPASDLALCDIELASAVAAAITLAALRGLAKPFNNFNSNKKIGG